MSDRAVGYVDRLLAQADGALATIWISGFFRFAERFDVCAVERAFQKLLAETPRLRSTWDPKRLAWRAADEQAARARVTERSAATIGDAVAATIAEPFDLTREIPVRVACVALDDGSTLLALQLHHAVGDGRASFFFTARLFALWRAELGQAGQVASAPPLAAPALGDGRALLAIAGNPRAALNLRKPACRILAARGAPLVRASDAVGRPIVRSFTVPLPSGLPGAVRRDLFYGALLAGLRGVLAAGESPIRLRIPVDLRPLFQIGATLENACSAIPIEIPRAWLSDLPTARARTLSAIVAATEGGVALGVLLETMLVARLATRAMLRDHLRPDMIAPRRANTMVTTYLGTVDRYLGEAPFPICDAFSHTPTWGVTAFSFRAHDGDRLVLNVGSFEGLWGEREYVRFFGALEEALPMLFKASGLAWKSGEGSGSG